MNDILTVNRVGPVVNKLKNQAKKIVLAGGCFDLLHLGHLTFLEKAKGAGDVLIILLESDEKIEKLKGVDRPINNQKDRAKILIALKAVDLVVKLSGMTKGLDYERIIQQIKPDIIATTLPDPHVHHKKRVAKLIGAKVKYVCRLVKNYSTGEMVRRIRSYPSAT